MKKDFQLFGGHVALDFANTLDFRYDAARRVELLSSYARLVAFVRQCGAITDGQMRRLLAKTSEADAQRTLQRAIELRETIYFLFLSAVKRRRAGGAHLRSFNRFLEETRVPDQMAWKKGGLERTHGDLAKTPDGLLWPVMDAAANLLGSSQRGRVRECSEESCRWLFLDHSKNRSRRWCNMQICGNRAKARRFYARTRERV
jgi:predicted RNA-binding Zn ribbon-like protein